MGVLIVNYHLDSIDSTNSWAMREKDCLNCDMWTIFSATEQIAGRGRYKRFWYSPKGKNLYMTLCLYLSSSSLGFRLTQSMALSICKVLNSYGCRAVLKWPNDVQVQGKKIAGILTEAAFTRGTHFYAIGIGVNINASLADMQTVPTPATSLYIEMQKESSVEDIKWQIARAFAEIVQKESANRFVHVHSEWETLMSGMIGMPYVVQHSNASLKGTVIGFEKDGSLLLKLADETVHRITSGDVFRGDV